MSLTYQNKTYWNDLVGNEMSLREVGWPEWTEAYNYYRYKLTSHLTEKAFDKYIQAPKRILEIGCGVGFWSNLITKKYPDAQYTGVDISASTIQKLKQKFTSPNIQFINTDFGVDFKNLPPEVTSQKYDLIVCFEVLLHIVDDTAWQHAVSNFNNLLSENGVAIISEPFFMFDKPPVYKDTMNCKVRRFEDYKDIIESNKKSILEIQARTFLLDNNFDFKHKLSRKAWNFFRIFYFKLLMIKNETLGKLLGKIAYAFDLFFVKKSKYGNTCRLLVIK
ncbi:MAG: class I SAM-dependent methyltransferase [Chitinophagaceae bacterium]